MEKVTRVVRDKELYQELLNDKRQEIAEVIERIDNADNQPNTQGGVTQ